MCRNRGFFERVAVEDDARATLALLDAAAVLDECGKPTEAAVLFSKIAENAEGQARAQALNGLAAQAQIRGESERGWSLLERAIEADPRWDMTHDNRRRLALAAHLSSGDERWQERLNQELAWLERDGPPGAAVVARLHVAHVEHRQAPSAGSRQALGVRIDAAVAEGLSPQAELPLRLIQGDLELERDQIGAAIERYRLALALDPNAAAPHAHLALAMGQLRDYATALAHLELALRDPAQARRAHLQAIRAVLLARQRQYEPARAALERAERAAGADLGAQLYVGRARQLVAEASVARTDAFDEDPYRVLLEVGDRYLELLPRIEPRGELAALRRRVTAELPRLGQVCGLFYAGPHAAPPNPICAEYGPPPPPSAAQLEEEVNELEELERAGHAAERERLLELERRAREASD